MLIKMQVNDTGMCIKGHNLQAMSMDTCIF